MSNFGKVQLKDQYGNAAECTPMDQLRTAHTYRLVGTIFADGTLDPNFWTSTVANGGTTVQSGGQVTLSTNTTANGSAILNSVRLARYIAGVSNYFRTIMRLPSINDDNNTRRWGLFTTTNGAFFELLDGALRVVTRKNSSDTAVANGDFNGDTTYTFDTNVKTFEIYYTNSKVLFVIGGKLVHTVTASTATWTDTVILPIRFENTNTSDNITDIDMEIRVASINRLGLAETAPTSKYISTNTTTTCKYGAGRLHRLIIGSPGTVGNTATIYDNTAGSGTVLAVIDTTAANAFVVDCNLDFFTGLTILTANNTAGKITVVYE